MSQAVTEANTSRIQSRGFNIPLVFLRIQHIEMPVVKKHQELQLISDSRKIEPINKRHRRSPDFIVNNPSVITNQNAFIVASNRVVAAESEFLAGRESFCRILSPPGQQPRKVPRQSSDPFDV